MSEANRGCGDCSSGDPLSPRPTCCWTIVPQLSAALCLPVMLLCIYTRMLLHLSLCLASLQTAPYDGGST